MYKRTYIDSNLLIAAFQGREDLSERALNIIDDPERKLVVSDAVRIEVMPKPHYEKREEELSFYNEIFNVSDCIQWSIATLIHAYNLAVQYGIAAMDAVHIATALEAGVDEFVTTEKTTKPMFRVTELKVTSLL